MSHPGRQGGAPGPDSLRIWRMCDWRRCSVLGIFHYPDAPGVSPVAIAGTPKTLRRRVSWSRCQTDIILTKHRCLHHVSQLLVLVYDLVKLLPPILSPLNQSALHYRVSHIFDSFHHPPRLCTAPLKHWQPVLSEAGDLDLWLQLISKVSLFLASSEDDRIYQSGLGTSIVCELSQGRDVNRRRLPMDTAIFTAFQVPRVLDRDHC